ncbi:MAG: cofactor-independent phosphoglycerate mutase [Oscillospiraceae bacterium]|jgi:2,3-bisphosphoglycerate-independent phosphoglycerate mutase|nr:MAG: cofactor-independent phosphoglycerate mutase [Oscillospiraceae bacterium]
MKYVVVLCDGMADYPVPALGGKTPMMVAKKPHIDALAAKAEVGLVRTVAPGLKPGSDVANMSVLGFDPHRFYTGRSPLEAASIGIDMKDSDVSLRTNLVTLSDKGEPFADKVIEDYCADDISTGEARQLIEAVQAAFGGGEYDFYTGVSYRHCLIWHGGTTELGNMTPPHDITGKVIGPHLSTAETARPLLEMMEKSFDLLKDHPVNKARVAAGRRPANCIWLWGEGKRPALRPFEALYGIKGGMVSAVDLLKGIANCAGMEVAEVPGATGYIDTDFEGKAKAALDLLTRNDLVYVHFEAPDECGHRNEPENKVKAIEMIDSRVLPILEEGLEQYEDYKILLLPDHPTPIVTRTHASDPVPYLLYQKSAPKTGVDTINEETAKATGIYMENGPAMMPHFLGQDA